MSLIPPAFVELKAKTDEFMAKMAEAKGEMDKLAKHGASAGAKLQSFGKYALAGVAGLAVGVGAVAIKSGIDAQAAQARLEAAVKASGNSWLKYKDKLEQAADGQAKYGFTASTTEDALADLTIATKSPQKAMHALTLAENVAAGMHMDLASAVNAVAKAYAGNARGLKQMAINLPIANGNAYSLVTANKSLASAQLRLQLLLQKNPAIVDANNKAHSTYITTLRSVKLAQERVNDIQNAGSQIVAALSKRFAGQASAAANTLQGRFKGLEAQGQNLLETIGLKLIPVVEALMNKFMALFGYLTRHKAILITLGSIIGGVLTTAITAYVYAQAKAFTKKTLDMIGDFSKAFKVLAEKLGLASAAQDTQTTATEGTTVATDELAASEAVALGPILGIIAAIAAFAVVVYEIIKHWKVIHEWTVKIWDKIWDFLKGAFNAIWGFIKKWGLDILLAFTAPWLLAIMVVMKFKKQILAAVSDALHWLLNTGEDIVKGLVSGLTSGAKLLWDFFLELPVKLLQFGADAGHWLIIMGEKLIEGLINGIKNMGGKVLSAVTGLLPGPLKGIVTGAGHAIASLFAEGGVVEQPTLAVVGEAGPEVILPLTNPERMRAVLNQAAPYLPQLSAASGGASIGGGSSVSSISTASMSQNVVINITGVSDPVAVAQKVRTELLKLKRGMAGVGLA